MSVANVFASETDLLTRFFLRLTRILQFLSVVISLEPLSSRLYKVYRLHGVSGAFGAVEGILAAAVAYTLLAILTQCIVKARGPKWLGWLWVLLGLVFIAISVLTRPASGPASPKHCYTNRSSTRTRRTGSCNLPWGTFVLAIVST
ncbi:hypothetical protein GQ44DRAFT_744595 [Phaeosphaeriaceae sp. PMI808]|nr:hypothetical protein GQ44DRAFT_744595 [Phaeosphaeriaceae sp. PMI808]